MTASCTKTFQQCPEWSAGCAKPATSMLHIHAPQITNVVPLVVPLDSADRIDVPTYVSESWAVLACVDAADAALQPHLSGPHLPWLGVFVTWNHATRADSTA